MPTIGKSRNVSRRDFVKAAAGGAAAAVLGCMKGQEVMTEARAAARPNLLVIHTDQQSAWTLGCYGGDLIETPHIDSLAREGALFENFFTNSPVCTPSRGCFVTGRYPHAHGAYHNDLELNRDEVTFAQALKDAGYDTGYSGKWHLDGPPKPGWMSAERSMGFGDCRYMFNRGHWKKIVDLPDGGAEAHPYEVMGDEKTYTTDWLAGKTIDFIRRRREGPFCYMVSIPDPHGPYSVRAPYDTMYDPANVPAPRTFKKGRRACSSEERIRAVKARYCGEVKCIDDNVGRMLACLKEQGIYDDTIVVFTTDHGDYMGEHGRMGKGFYYETAIRIPFVMRWPKRIPPGTRIERCATTVDFLPTVLALMGVESPGREQGRDASALLLGEEAEWDDVAQIHHASLARAFIFTQDFELALEKEGPGVLFDRRNDPDQMKNIFDDPAHRDVRAELTRRIVEHHKEVGSPAYEWLKALRV